MRKLYEKFHILHFQKIKVSTETNRRNTVFSSSRNNFWNVRQILINTSHCVLVMSVTWWYVHFYSMASETKIIDDSYSKKPFKSESFQGTDILNIILMLLISKVFIWFPSFEALVNITYLYFSSYVELFSIICLKFHY
jgi:hypothetical protein